MASVEKQTIFEMPMKQVSEITIILDGSWHLPITRVWGRRKEVGRHLFKIQDDMVGYRWFECNSEMADEILSLIDRHAGNRKELCLILNPLRVKYPRPRPKREFLSMWERFKRFVWGK